MRETVRKITSFSLVGGGIFVAGQLMLRLLVSGLWWNASIANACVQIASVWLNYRLNQTHTWRGAIGCNQARRFISTRILTTLLSLELFNAFTTIGLGFQLASSFGVIAGMAVNFIVADRWVFKPSRTTLIDHDLSLGWRTGLTVLVGLVAIVTALRVKMADLFLPALMVSLSLIAAVAAILYLTVLVYGHRNDESYDGLALRPLAGDRRQEKFAVLMPARHELGIYGRTILNAYLTQSNHGQFRLIPVICHDDPNAIRVAMAAANLINRLPRHRQPLFDDAGLWSELERDLEDLSLDGSSLSDDDLQAIASWRDSDAMVQVIVFPLLGGQNSSKPLQMNYALTQIASDDYTVFTIVDAESQIQPGLFDYVDQAFQDHSEVSVIQGAVQLMDPVYHGTRRQQLRQRLTQWYAWHNLLEYYRLNAGQMPFQQNNNFVPLCGNTVFIRSDMIHAAGGWPETLTEDCALGVLLTARYQVKVLSFYMPQVATREETPPTMHDLIKQRTRWTQGFLQSLLQGEWRLLATRRQRLLALWILTSPFTQATVTPLLLLTVATAGFRLFVSPPFLVMIMFAPLMAMLVVVILQLSQLHDYGRDYSRNVPWYVYAQVVVTMIPYQVMLSYAAIRAVARHYAGNLEWQSPARTGDHFYMSLPIRETVS